MRGRDLDRVIRAARVEGFAEGYAVGLREGVETGARECEMGGFIALATWADEIVAATVRYIRRRGLATFILDDGDTAPTLPEVLRDERVEGLADLILGGSHDPE